MQAVDINLLTTSDSLELRATITSPFLKEPFLLWYRFPLTASQFIAANVGNPLVAALLLPAMKTGEAIELSAPISPKLGKSVKWIQTIYRTWDPTLSFVEIRAPLREEHPLPGPNVGLFFSAGVDSFYSLLKNVMDHPLNEDTITTLILVYGADIYLSDGKGNVFAKMYENTQAVAEHFGKEVVPVVTNAKELLAAYRIRRGFLGHGTTLATVGLALEGMFRKIYLASGRTYNDLIPMGIHPLLDPLWSTESCTFVHDGLEATRLEKTRLIAQSEIALNTLRVCWAKESLEYNCGQCAKCLRTMLGLYVAGALKRCRTLPTTIDPELLARIPLLGAYEEASHFQDLLDALGDSESDALIRAALQTGLAKGSSYFARLARAKRHIRRLIPVQDQFILVDEDIIRPELGIGQKTVPFMEQNGQYYGLPADDATAIQELERLRAEGAKFIVFWWADFWCLDYYTGFNSHLRASYPCILEDESLVIFDLRTEISRTEQDSSRFYAGERA
jgi:hypothetical protein